MAGRIDGTSALQDDGPNISMTPGGSSEDSIPTPKSLGYRQIMQSVNNSMRSDFTSQAMTPNGESPESRRSQITQSLRGAENAAGSAASTSGLDASSGENSIASDSATSSFVNNVGRLKEEKENPGNSGSDGGKVNAGFMKKHGPIVTIIISLIAGGGGMYMTQAALPFTMLDKINDIYDSINVSTNIRASSFMRSMAKNTGKVADPGGNITKKNVFGQDKFAPTSKMKKKLAANGIEFGKKGTADAGKMIFTDSKGMRKSMSVAEFKTEFNANPEFRKAYSNGTRTWKTSVEEFNDGIFEKLLKRFNISKNRHADYNVKDDPDGKKGMKRMAEDVDASTSGEDISTRTSKATREDVEVKDANGNISTKPEGKIEAEGTKTEAGVKGAKAKSVSEKLDGVKNVVGSLTTLGCGITKAYSAIKLILAAAQVAQVVAVAQEMFEGIDKARAGDSASSPINAIGRALVEQASEEREVVSKVDIDYGGAESENPDGEVISDDKTNVEYETVFTASRSAVQSEGLSSLFTGDPINTEDESVSSFVPNVAAEKAINAVESDIVSKFGGSDSGGGSEAVAKLMRFAGTSIDFLSTKRLSYRTCLVMDSAISAVNLAVDVAVLIQGIGGLFNFGATTFAAIAEKAIWETFKIGVSAAIGIAVSAIIGYLAPVIANIFTRKLVTQFVGEDLGNAVIAGSGRYLPDNHRGGDGLYVNKSGLVSALTYQDAVNREEAKSDRLARSPFDYTSANTFAGQLAVSMTPVLLQADSIGGAVGNFGKVIGNSVKSLLLTASAISVSDKVNISEAQTAKNCPELDALGIMADGFCNPYVATDYSTIETDDSKDIEDDENSPYSIIKRVAEKDPDNFVEGTDIDSVDNPKINMSNKSELYQFIVYCGGRVSPLGLPDQNIASAIDLDKLDTVSESVVNAIPVIGDGLSMLSNQSILNNYGYVSGANCVMVDDENEEKVNNEKSELGNDPDYETIKLYSRYAGDQRLAESMGLIEKSAVAVALDEYYEAHPLDNSTEGVLARLSGLTKEQVIAVEDTVDFYNFYLAYDPTYYYPTPKQEEEDPSYTIEDKDFVNDDGLLAVMRSCETEPLRRLNVAAA